jgi:hypothetical protein
MAGDRVRHGVNKEEVDAGLDLGSITGRLLSSPGAQEG